MMRDLGRVFASALGFTAAERFGDDQYSGFHDGVEGLQWHVACDMDGRTRLGVNLEGLKYGRERRIRRFLIREASRPRIPQLVRASAHAEDICVEVVRGGWPGPRTRIYIEERDILNLPGFRVNDDLW